MSGIVMAPLSAINSLFYICQIVSCLTVVYCNDILKINAKAFREYSEISHDAHWLVSQVLQAIFATSDLII